MHGLMVLVSFRDMEDYMKTRFVGSPKFGVQHAEFHVLSELLLVMWRRPLDVLALELKPKVWVIYFNWKSLMSGWCSEP